MASVGADGHAACNAQAPEFLTEGPNSCYRLSTGLIFVSPHNIMTVAYRSSVLYTSDMSLNVFQQCDAALKEVEELEQAKAVAYAAEVRVLARLAELYDGDGSLFLELSGTARIGQIRAAGSCDRACRLVERFPVALGLLECGEMFVGTAQLLLALTKHCTGAVQAEVDRRLSARVATMDAADARALIAATVPEVESELELAEQERRHAQAKANRGVWVKPIEHGMARVGAETDAISAKEFALALEELERAQALEDARLGVERTKAQRLADVLMELPARHLALIHAARSGRLDALLADALAQAQETSTTGPDAPTSVQDALPLNLPPAGPPRPWDLPPEEVAAALLRLPVRRQRVLNVHAGASTLLGLDHQSCLVEGLGPLPGWLARHLQPEADLRRVLVDRATGLPLHLGETVPPLVEVDLEHPPHTPPPDPPPGSPPPESPPDPSPAPPSPAEGSARAWAELCRLSEVILGPPALLPEPEPQYVPSAGLRRLVQLRDLRCTGPGCSRTATACDLDHETEYARGGLTDASNLSLKSRRCHVARHDGWEVVRDSVTGISTWTSPLGRVYTRLPAWRPPARLPDAVLGHPVPRAPVTARTEYPEDRPLWPAPPPVTPTKPAPATPARAGGLGWDDGTPPPF